MARITASEVKEVFETDLTDAQIDAFITAANLIVTDQLSGEHSDSLLKEIERYMAAHLAASRDQRIVSEKHVDMSVAYQGKYGMNLMSTDYGQTAATLDSSGKLANLGKKKAQFFIT
jgi:hypothetical protein